MTPRVPSLFRTLADRKRLANGSIKHMKTPTKRRYPIALSEENNSIITANGAHGVTRPTETKCLRVRAGCVSNPIRRQTRRFFLAQPAHGGRAREPESDSRRTRHRRREQLLACQPPARFRRSFSSDRWKSSVARSRRFFEILFLPNPAAAGFSVCVRPGNFSVRPPLRDASGEFGRGFCW